MPITMKPMLLDKGKGLFHQGWLSVHHKVPPFISREHAKKRLWMRCSERWNAETWVTNICTLACDFSIMTSANDPIWFTFFFLNQVISLSNCTSLDLTFKGIIHPQRISRFGQLPPPPVARFWWQRCFWNDSHLQQRSFHRFRTHLITTCTCARA